MATIRSSEKYPFNLLFDIGIEDVCNNDCNFEENLNEVLLTLKEREQKILNELYRNNLTSEECGKIFGVTRERIRQIQREALRKLKHPSRQKCIKYGKLAYDYSNMKSELIAEMELSVRSYNCLRRGGIKKIEDLEGLTCEDLMKIRNLGRKSMMEIIEKAAEYGIEIKQA